MTSHSRLRPALGKPAPFRVWQSLTVGPATDNSFFSFSIFLFFIYVFFSAMRARVLGRDRSRMPLCNVGNGTCAFVDITQMNCSIIKAAFPLRKTYIFSHNEDKFWFRKVYLFFIIEEQKYIWWCNDEIMIELIAFFQVYLHIMMMEISLVIDFMKTYALMLRFHICVFSKIITIICRFSAWWSLRYVCIGSVCLMRFVNTDHLFTVIIFITKSMNDLGFNLCKII